MPDSQPTLAGWRVVVTRAAEQNASLEAALRRYGAEPVAYPTIAFAPPTDEDESRLAQAVRGLIGDDYDWLVLTSATGVRALRARLDQHSSRLSADIVTIAVVGAATARVCREELGLNPAVVPDTFIAEELAAALGNMSGQRVLLVQGDLARAVLCEQLVQAGANVEAVVAYRTVPATSGGADVPALLADGAIQAITFTSGSTVRNFVQRIGPQVLEHAREQQVVIACIGPVTAEAAEHAGLPVSVVAEPSTIEGLAAALAAWQTQRHTHT
jgi:uroporphyrinogen-III synthase